MDPFSLWCWRQWGIRPAVKNGKQVAAISTPCVLQRSTGHPKKQLQGRVPTALWHWDRRGQHPLGGQSSSSHNLQTENWTLSAPLPPTQTDRFPLTRMPVRHRSLNHQPHSAVLPRLRRFETPDMAQSGGWPQETLVTNQNTAAEYGLCLTHRTETLAWPGMQKKNK